MDRVTLKADFTERERIIAQTQLQHFIFKAFVKECDKLSQEDQNTLGLLVLEFEEFDHFCDDFSSSNLSDDELKEKAASYNDLFDKLRTLQAQNAVNILKPLPESMAGYRSYPDKNHETLNDFNVVQSCIAMFEELRSNFESPNPSKPVSEVERKKYKELCDFLISTAARIQGD